MELRLYYAGTERSGRCVRRRATRSGGLWQEIQGGREMGGATHTRWRVQVQGGRQGCSEEAFAVC